MNLSGQPAVFVLDHLRAHRYRSPDPVDVLRRQITETPCSEEIIQPYNEIDNFYFQVETSAHPMHWGLIVELDCADGAISLSDLRIRARERARAYDLLRYGVQRKRLRAPRLVVHHDWDAADNVCSHNAADPIDSQSHINALMETALGAGRPLWQLDLIDQQQPRRQLLLLRVHHAVADGLAGTGFGVLFADGEHTKLREFERFLLTPRLSPAVPTDIDDPVTAFTKSWIAGMTLRRQLPPISGRGTRVTAFGYQSLSEVRQAASISGASLSEHLLAVTGRIIGQHGRSSQRRVRLGSAVSLDEAMRHTGNATSVITVDIDRGPDQNAIASIRDQLGRARAGHIELAFVASQRRNSALPWPVQRTLTRTTARLFRSDAAVSINPLLLNIESVFGSKVSRVYGLGPPVRFPLSVVYLLSARQVSYGLVADPHALRAPIAQIANALGTQLAASNAQMESKSR